MRLPIRACDVVLFEHVGAHEVGDVLHLLHGHRAVEQLHGLVAADPELPLERRRVRLEGVMDGRAGGPELLLQLRGSWPKLAKSAAMDCSASASE